MATEEHIPTSAGLSSFNLLDERNFFAALALAPGMTLLDFGCGVGNYTMAASPFIGDRGRIFALDLWEEGIETLEVRTSLGARKNVTAAVYDAGKRFPIDDQVVDLTLLATVVHILVRESALPDVFTELKRVMKPEGKVAVVEFYRKMGPPGPPLSWRLSPDKLEEIFHRAGFMLTETVPVGQHNYLSFFCRQG